MSVPVETLQGLAQSAWLAGLAALLALALDRPLARRGRHGARGVLWSLVLLRLALPVDAGLPTGIGRALVPAQLDALVTQLAASAHPARVDDAPPRSAGRPGEDRGPATSPASASAPRLVRAPGMPPLLVTASGQARTLGQATRDGAARHAAAGDRGPRRHVDGPDAGRVSTPGDSEMPARRPSATHAAVLGGTWLVGTLTLLLWAWVVTRIHRRRLLAARRHDLPAWWPAVVAGACRRAGLAPASTVLVSDAAPGAAALGVWRPLIVLPPDLLDLGPRAVELVLLHEATHLRRHDTRLAALTWVVAALWWWHPAAWLARRRLALLRELGCDARVVQSLDGRRGDYGATLLAAADLARGRAPLPALAGASGDGLGERLETLIAGPRATRRAPVLALAAGLALLLGPGVEAATTRGGTAARPAPSLAAAPGPPSAPLDPLAGAARAAGAATGAGAATTRGAAEPSRADHAPAPGVPEGPPSRAAVAALLAEPGCLVRHLAAAALARRGSSPPFTDGSPPSTLSRPEPSSSP